MNTKELQQLFEKKIKRIEELQSQWYRAKRSHFKAWEAEYEIWPDESSKNAARQWERSAHEDVLNIEERLKIARDDLKRSAEQVTAEFAGTEPPEAIKELLRISSQM